MNRIIVTGSSGLIGSALVEHFHRAGWQVHGVDNNMRARFFGVEGDTRWNQERLLRECEGFVHHEIDMRARDAIDALVAATKPQAIVHAAAQPSHDRAADIPFEDFETNALGTLNILEAARKHCLDAPFVFMSTNKVYGDRPNAIRMKETATRWVLDDPMYANGFAEDLSIDQCTHSLFGASKLAADVLVQEYGRYFGMPTCCLRGGCLTGPRHSGVAMHGFLSYLVRCGVEGRPYRVFGYKGKQVRDNIHASDVAAFIEAYIASPRVGEVYNLGGGAGNTCSILEAIQAVSGLTGRAMHWEYEEKARKGDHICYYSDLSRARAHYPQWDVRLSLPRILSEIHEGWRSRA